MSDKAWDTISMIALMVVVALVILGISLLIYMSSSQTHMENLSMIESCAIEYAFNSTEKVYYVTREYCGGTAPQLVTPLNAAPIQVQPPQQ